MLIALNTNSLSDYEKFLRIKALPRYRIVGDWAEFPDEYAGRVGLSDRAAHVDAAYRHHPKLFDYQRDIADTAIKKRKYAVFADCGLGKTMILFEYAKHALESLPSNRGVLIITPSMVIPQMLDEWRRFYGDDNTPERVRASELGAWVHKCGGRIGITNYEALRDDTEQGHLGAMVLDESSMLKSHYGSQGQHCIRIGKGLDWKLCLTGTPAPNDRIEYANHAVFLDHFPTVNSFLARFFVNRGETGERWELKPHALKDFYVSLSHWSIFLCNPATYGWKDNCKSLPPIHVHIHDVPLTQEQRDAVGTSLGTMFVDQIGGIGSRQRLGRLAKGDDDGTDIPSNKPGFIQDLVKSWPKESTLVWCLYNREQDTMEMALPKAASLRGETDEADRVEMVRAFKAGEVRQLISKPKILGFGLNLQIATRQVFSGLQDSYESYYQAVKRSNRIGSTKPLHVHIPVTEIEAPMVETVLRKAARVEQDTKEQEALFRAAL